MSLMAQPRYDSPSRDLRTGWRVGTKTPPATAWGDSTRQGDRGEGRFRDDSHCKWPDCPRKSRASGFCENHEHRVRQGEKPGEPRSKTRRFTAEERAEIVRLVRCFVAPRVVAKRFDTCPATVLKIVKAARK